MPPRVRQLIQDPENDLLLSVASVWEIMIKGRLGRFELDRPPKAYILYYMGELSLIPTAISLEHLFRTVDLPGFHQDPFDRLLIAQAMTEDIPIVTRDAAIQRYDVRTVWSRRKNTGEMVCRGYACHPLLVAGTCIYGKVGFACLSNH